METYYNFPMEDWDKAKNEIILVLIEYAKQEDTISYSELTQKVQTIKFEPDAYAFHTMLGEISREEDDAGRGMLSVIITHKDGDKQPGLGFFELARQLGRDTSDKMTCWITELTRVYDYWKKK